MAKAVFTYNHDLAQRKAEGRMKNRPHACEFTDEMKREALSNGS